MNTEIHYLSTSIPYVNSEPHVGFALELVLADTLARHRRSKGCDILFQGGTDDNSLKNVRAAEALGIDVKELVSNNADRFINLADNLDVKFDKFISTGTNVSHKKVVEKLWYKCLNNGDLYRKSYEGLYCVGCEQFYTQAELKSGCCPEHKTEPEEISENNWFFRLSRYASKIKTLIENNSLKIVPETKRNEVLSILNGEVYDICVSRSAERARGWGIPVPGDKSEVIYVWFDALANYITGAGYDEDEDYFNTRWSNSKTREHIIGKGISRFHAVYWPAILLSAGLTPPSRVLIHGYLTVEGQKIGKSNGNGVNPFALIDNYGVDAVRWYLLRHIRSTDDADFSEERLVQTYNNDLAGQLGNLVNRTISIIKKYDGEYSEYPDVDSSFRLLGHKLVEDCDKAIEEFAIHDAANAISKYVAEANKYIVRKEPWHLIKQNDESSRVELNSTITELLACFGIVSKCIYPILPNGAEKLQSALDKISQKEFEIPLLFPQLQIKYSNRM